MVRGVGGWVGGWGVGWVVGRVGGWYVGWVVGRVGGLEGGVGGGVVRGFNGCKLLLNPHFSHYCYVIWLICTRTCVQTNSYS